jgi:hypothetical protein
VHKSVAGTFGPSAGWPGARRRNLRGGPHPYVADPVLFADVVEKVYVKRDRASSCKRV